LASAIFFVVELAANEFRAINAVIGIPKPTAMKAIAMHDANNLKISGGKSSCPDPDHTEIKTTSPMKPNMDMKISTKIGGRDDSGFILRMSVRKGKRTPAG